MCGLSLSSGFENISIRKVEVREKHEIKRWRSNTQIQRQKLRRQDEVQIITGLLLAVSELISL